MKIVLFIHLLSAVGLGYYLLFPFLMTKLKGLPAAGQAGFLRAMKSFNLIGQFLLVVQLLTGGFLVSKWHLSVPFMIAAIVDILIIFALAGMLSGALKKAIKTTESGGAVDYGKVNTFAILVFVFFFLMLVLMKFPSILG